MRLLLLLLLLSVTAASYKILVYNVKFGHSHSNFMGRIADILVDAGHDVTSLIPVLDPKVVDGTTKSRVIQIPTNEESAVVVQKMLSGSEVDFWEDNMDGPLTAAFVGHFMSTMFCKQCESTLAHPGLLEQLKAEKFDVFINENFDLCGIGLAHAIGAKSTIVVTTTTIHDNVAYDLGIPVVPSFNPAFAADDLDIHSIWSRAKNVIQTHTVNLMFGPIHRCTDVVYKETFGAKFPEISDLTSRAALVFTNSEPFIDFARPLLRKVIDLGGIGVKQPKPLDQHWDKMLSLRPQNVLVSFGSMAKSALMKPERKVALLKVFAAFPNVTFIWKYENPEDDFAKQEVPRLQNVVLTKWMPQNDLLNDKRMTAFISHAGMGSCQEAASRGVPGLFIPLFGDQPRNAAMMEFNGIGLKMRKDDAKNAEKLTAAVHELLHSKSIRLNAKRISAMLAKRPFTPHDLLIKNVEFVAEFGPSEALTPRGIQLGWIQYFLVDIIAIAMLVVAVVSSALAYFFYRIFRRFFVKINSKKVKRS